MLEKVSPIVQKIIWMFEKVWGIVKKLSRTLPKSLWVDEMGGFVFEK